MDKGRKYSASEIKSKRKGVILFLIIAVIFILVVLWVLSSIYARMD